MTNDDAYDTPESRKALYKRTKAIVDQRRMSWDQFFHYALGLTSVGTGYVDNFRAGRISRRNAHSIARFLERYYSGGGAEVSSISTVLGRVHEIEAVPNIGDERLYPIHHLDAGAYFSVSLDNPVNGEAIGLRRCDGIWYPFRLGAASFRADVQKGRQRFPIASAESPPIYALDIPAHHIVCIVISKGSFQEDVTRAWKAGVTLDRVFGLVRRQVDEQPEAYEFRFDVMIAPTSKPGEADLEDGETKGE